MIIEGSPHILILENDDGVDKGIQVIHVEAGYYVKLALTGEKATDIIE
jgi:hypothetical protein